MYKIFSRRLGYLVVAFQLCLTYSVYSSDLEQNYYSNTNYCNGYSCEPSQTFPQNSDSNLVNITFHSNASPPKTSVKQWTFLNTPVKNNVPSPVYTKSGEQNNLYQNYPTQIDFVTPKPIAQDQQTQYNNLQDQYYYNATAQQSYSNLQTTEPATRKEDGYGYNEDVAHIQTDVNLTPDGLKFGVIAVAIGYVLLVLLAKTNVLSLADSLSPCFGPPPGEFPTSFIHSENPLSLFTSHGDPALQQQLFDMFSPYRDDSNEDDWREMPDLPLIASMCSKNAFFYGMNHQHMEAVQMITDVFMREPDLHGMMSMAKALRHSPYINVKVWYTALMKASHERSDMRGMIMPGPMDAMPDTFIPGNHVGRTISSFRSSRKSRSHKKQKCIRVDGSVGADNGIENLLWYFREDVMVNSHHWYWHLSYPLMSKTPRDRRGELFYYSHGSMITRYNIERLTHGLEIAVPLDVFPDAPIPEGYSAHLTDLNSGMPWTDRPPYTVFTDILHYDNPNSRSALFLEPWLQSRDRILKSIHAGRFLTAKGFKRAIPRYEGINILGNTLEANDESINPRYYTPDGYHNTGHRIIGYLADPHYTLQLPPGPMGDPATAMRDPVFYRWHTNIHNIFQAYKSTLKPYQPVGGDFPLLWNGVEVEGVGVVSKKGSRNELTTFWNRKKFQLSLGLAFNRSEDSDDHFDEHLDVCATHLDHEEFEYDIHINRRPCAKSKSSSATVRVFIAPRYDLHGKRLTITQQRRLFVHLDLFTVNLNVGRNIIKRHSTQSTLTIPFTQSLRQLQTNFGNRQAPNCGCGWPHHLLLPKGTPDGMSFDLFVMVTNGDNDLVPDGHTNPFEEQCASNFIYCGIQNRRYPDAKPMGYPFDREVYRASLHCNKWGHSIWSKICSLFEFDWRTPNYLEDYTWGITNMGFSQVLITHVPKK